MDYTFKREHIPHAGYRYQPRAVRTIDRERLDMYREMAREAGYKIHLLANTAAVKFRNRIQLYCIKDQTKRGFSRWEHMVRFLQTGEMPNNPHVVWVQGHRNIIERHPGFVKGHGKLFAIKDTGERSPEFSRIGQCIRWLEIMPY